MSRISSKPFPLTRAQGRSLWLRAQRLDARAPFGGGPEATRLAVEHLGYVQIDTINVIERCHHHILYSRIPDYQRVHLHQAQSIDKTVFEYWTHALSYIPTRDLHFFIRDMRQQRTQPIKWYSGVTKQELRKVLTLIRKGGGITIRDIDDDVLTEKDHLWASRKPSKRALQLAFYSGTLTISARSGMVKTYELMERHFAWDKRPKPASERDITAYQLDRALRAQGIVSLDSICYMNAPSKQTVRRLIDTRVRRQELVPVALEDAGKTEYWARPEVLDAPPQQPDEALVHILSPFDPLIIQRKRLQFFFDYEHRFEAYVPKEKRVFGYFVLPVLVGDKVVAAVDLKTDRENRKLLVQKWNWIGRGSARTYKRLIEEELHRFERFQLAGVPNGVIPDAKSVVAEAILDDDAQALIRAGR
ncbi:winged helix-turn-helix domain-containing protein [Vineibacter terrae]|uniref:winged helix-turn-helix domain-containing protein n=1 Tax=Vineibacter terrae TaxID=2586908 RepID=UPI002E37CF0E|nr:crosslink repair DNA glycosylase YcaQ family protein [Vineibacter terrae]HEX2886642.1 crosslink repair DNA glycosylase YcaQ family protein [Vineibacter terrae]